jgi:carbon monoxide dehydrogenase subunit G
MMLLSVSAATPAVAAPSADTAARRVADLSVAERRALLRGDVVTRPMRFRRGGGSFVGGLSYAVVKATPDEVLQALSNAETLPEALPRTVSARLIEERGDVRSIELVQGRGAFTARYTIQLRSGEENGTLRFSLDRSRPHDISDVWGFFRARSLGGGRTLVTVAAAIDLGPGISRFFFEDRLERTILGAPHHIRQFVEPRALAASE